MKVIGAVIGAALCSAASALVADRADLNSNNFHDPLLETQVRTHTAATYQECEKITAGPIPSIDFNGAANDRFGFESAFDGQTIAISAPYMDDCTGAVYLYERDQGLLTQTDVVQAPPEDLRTLILFGEALDIDDGILVVSSKRYTNSSGRAYVYARQPDATFDHIATLNLFTLVNDGNPRGDTFGWDVAVKNGIIAVSSAGDDTKANQNGAVFIFKVNGSRDGVDFVQKIFSENEFAKESFGTALALGEDGTLVVGAYRTDSTGVNTVTPDETGMIHVFKPNATMTEWTLFASTRGSDSVPGDRFGFDVAITGQVIAVGADGQGGDNGGTGLRVGKVYIFDITAQGISEEDSFSSDDVYEGDGFGTKVSFGSDSRLIVGAHFADTGPSADEKIYHAGSAWIYEFQVSGTWEQVGRFTPIDVEERDYVGHSVALGADFFVVGATGDDDKGSHAGAAYICDINPQQPPEKPCDETKEDLDVAFIMDTSGSISDSEFRKMQRFLRKISQNFTLGDDVGETRFALVPFASSVDYNHVVEFDDDAAIKGWKWRRWIRDLCRWGGWTDIPEALIYTYKYIFEESNDRTKVVVILTDGFANRRTGCSSETSLANVPFSLDPEECSQDAAIRLKQEDDVYFIYIPIGPDSSSRNEAIFPVPSIADKQIPTSINNLVNILNEVVEEIECVDDLV